MYATVFSAEKLTAAEQAQLIRDVERRRIIASRTRRAAAPPEPPLSGRSLTGLVPRFANARLRTL
jgi:hypothetical protein